MSLTPQPRELLAPRETFLDTRMAPRLRGMAADPALKAHGVSVVDYEQQLV